MSVMTQDEKKRYAGMTGAQIERLRSQQVRGRDRNHDDRQHRHRSSKSGGRSKELEIFGFGSSLVLSGARDLRRLSSKEVSIVN